MERAQRLLIRQWQRTCAQDKAHGLIFLSDFTDLSLRGLGQAHQAPSLSQIQRFFAANGTAAKKARAHACMRPSPKRADAQPTEMKP